MKKSLTIALFLAAAVATGLLCGCSSAAAGDDMLMSATHVTRERARLTIAWERYMDEQGIEPGAALSDLSADQLDQLVQTATLYCGVDRGRPQADVGGCTDEQVFDTACKIYLHQRYGTVADRWQRQLEGGFSAEDNRADLFARAELAHRIGLEWGGFSAGERRAANLPEIEDGEGATRMASAASDTRRERPTRMAGLLDSE